jgi:drug/metabolite transporter (DMT)-like permease
MKSVANISGLTSINSSRSIEVAAEGRSQILKLPFLAALLANLIWGASFLASKVTLLAWEPITASAIRFAIATLAIFIGLRISKREIQLPRQRRDWIFIFATSTVGFGLLYPLQLMGLKHISSGFSSAVMLLSPLVVVALSSKVFNESLSRPKILALGLGVLGGLTLLGSRHGFLETKDSLYTGVAFTFSAAVCLALSVVFTKKLGGRVDSGSLTFWTMAIGFVELCILAFVFEEHSVANSFSATNTTSWMAIVFLGVVCSALCFFLWNWAVTSSSAKDIASTMHIKTPTAVLLGAFAGGETITMAIVVGTIVVSLGVWISQRPSSKEARNA